MQIIQAKLSELKIDPANVRKTDTAPDESFIASIRAKGVISPLTVRKNGAGYLVTDGGKRLAVLTILAKAGELEKDAIPCIVREETAATAADISLTTNFVREDMHDVDVYEAFADLLKSGKSTEDIAREYGLPVPTVRQHLALGALSPKVRAAWKAEELGHHGEAIARLFTLAGDHAQQDAIFDKLKKQKNLNHNWEVRRAIVGNSNEAGQLVAFVGVDVYKAAGGRIVEDLFGSDHRIEDPAIAKRLVGEKLKAECERLLGLGWSWVEPLETLPQGCQHSWNRAYDSVEQFPKTKRKDWGLALYVGRDGKLDEYIMQKPAQKKAADKAAKTKAAKKAATTGAAPAAEEAHISQALNHKLSIALTEAAAAAIVLQPDLAFSISLAALLAGYNSSNVKLHSTGHGSPDDDEDEWEFEAALQHVMKQTPKQRAALFALHVGRSFSFIRHQGNPLDPETSDAHVVCDAIDAKAMNKALRDRFDAADYFAGASKTIAIAALKECDPNYNVSGLSAMKKAEIATTAADQAISFGWLPPELRIKGYDGPGSKAFKPKTSTKKPIAAKPVKRAKKKAA
jgi:ParB family chromosome partitioning protein